MRTVPPVFLPAAGLAAGLRAAAVAGRLELEADARAAVGRRAGALLRATVLGSGLGVAGITTRLPGSG